MTIPLTLPRLSTSVPPVLVPTTQRGENAKLAQYLLQARALRATDIPRQWVDPLAVCSKALDRWTRRHIGPLRCIDLKIWLEPLTESPSYACATLRDGGNIQGGKAIRYDRVRLAWCSEVYQWPVGAGLEGLERLLPGLGATALNILSRRADLIVPLFTPVVAEYWASWLYWYGETNEEFALMESCGDDEEAKEAMRADMVTRAKLEAAFPAWALSPSTHRITSRALKAVDTTGWHSSAAEFVADLLRLDRLKVRDDCRPDVDGEFIGFSAVLSWREDDMTVRIFDDGVNSASEAEFCDIAGERFISLDAPQEMAEWLKSMRRRMRIIALVDRLIWRLAHADWLNTTEPAPAGTPQDRP